MEPLNNVAKDDPVSCARYAKEHDLLNTEDWKIFKRFVNREKKMHQMTKYVHAYDCRHGPVYMFGVQVPKSTKQSLEFHKINKNNLRQIALQKEIGQLGEYDTFEDFGYGVKAPDECKKIKVHVIYSVKHDRCRKCCCYADGHLQIQ
jgi:hypothetical protein